MNVSMPSWSFLQRFCNIKGVDKLWKYKLLNPTCLIYFCWHFWFGIHLYYHPHLQTHSIKQSMQCTSIISCTVATTNCNTAELLACAPVSLLKVFLHPNLSLCSTHFCCLFCISQCRQENWSTLWMFQANKYLVTNLFERLKIEKKMKKNFHRNLGDATTLTGAHKSTFAPVLLEPSLSSPLLVVLELSFLEVLKSVVDSTATIRAKKCPFLFSIAF